jgi:plastocyanin domain-containing protein
MLIGLIIWWFWLFKPATATANGDILVTVEAGSYTPSHIQLKAYQPATLTFLRKDASPCAEIAMIPELGISETLILNQPISVSIPGLAPGEYTFQCQMQMYRGILKIEL